MAFVVCRNVHVSFVKRQANEVAHALAKAAYSCMHSMYWQEVPNFIRHLLAKDVRLVC